MKNNGLLIVFSGPSGVGKDTVLKRILGRNLNLRLSVSATTRAPRPGEADGKDYYFLSREQFSSMAGRGEMLESAEYCGNFYGTPAEPIRAWLEEGHDVILEIEVQGGAQVMKKCPGCVGIFILPPSLETLEQRLRNRKTESEEAVQNRLAAARREISEVVHYHYLVINDTVEHAVEQIDAILCAEKNKVDRNAEFLERMLNHA